MTLRFKHLYSVFLVLGIILFGTFFLALGVAQAATCNCWIKCTSGSLSEAKGYTTFETSESKCNQRGRLKDFPLHVYDAVRERCNRQASNEDIDQLKAGISIGTCFVSPVDFSSAQTFHGEIGSALEFAITARAYNVGDSLTALTCNSCKSNDKMSATSDLSSGLITISWDTINEKLPGAKTIEVEAKTKNKGGPWKYEVVINLDPINCTRFGKTKCESNGHCLYHEGDCLSKEDPRGCPPLPKRFCGTVEGNKQCIWNEATGKCNSPLQSELSKQYDYSLSAGASACGLDGTCDNLNDVLYREAIVWALWAFGFIGIVGMLGFIVGGMMMILSFGNPERFKMGRQFLVASVVGLIIAFSAYTIVEFILNALGVSDAFRGI